MAVADVIAFAGHRVHVCRNREAGQLLRWLGDLRELRVLDVAGGDGYWAGAARRRGADAVSVDLSRPKILRGRRLTGPPALIEADALALPFADGSFDRVMSICAIEHFDDGELALDEMARVLRPGGELVLSADALTRAARWPQLYRAHCARYRVKRTYTHATLGKLLADRGFDVTGHAYQFRSLASERFYLGLSAHGGRAGFNLAAPLTPLVAASDRWCERRAGGEQGSIVLVRARLREAGAGMRHDLWHAQPRSREERISRGTPGAR